MARSHERARLKIVPPSALPLPELLREDLVNLVDSQSVYASGRQARRSPVTLEPASPYRALSRRLPRSGRRSRDEALALIEAGQS